MKRPGRLRGWLIARRFGLRCLVTRTHELGVFVVPEEKTDQELRDAIAAEEASAAWLDRLEQLPTDED